MLPAFSVFSVFSVFFLNVHVFLGPLVCVGGSAEYFSRDDLVLSLLTKEQELQATVTARNTEIARLSEELTTIHESYALKIQAAVREIHALHEV